MNWTARALLEAWGLRQAGSLKNPLKVSTGGKGGADFEFQAMRFVESVEGFDTARPVLVCVYVEGKDPSNLHFRLPGEPPSQAMYRMGWVQWKGIHEREVPHAILMWFVERLEEKLQGQPFQPIPPEDEETAVHIANTAGTRKAS